MFRLIPALTLLAACFFLTAEVRAESPIPTVSSRGENESSEGFIERLNSMLERTEKSIKLAREQIVQSQTAPFLPQLYMQLAELLSQKSNTLYYLKMEKEKSSAIADVSDKAFSPVIQAQQESISIYKIILKEFPQFNRRAQALFRLATAYKSIDDVGQFVSASGALLKQYPQTEDAIRIRLILGQHFFEKRQDDEAMRMLVPVAQSGLVYERNLAKYRIGLIYIARDRFREAQTQFEQIVTDPELKEQENPYELSLKKTRKTTRADLKRDALIDSIRTYTHVFAKNPDPINYYSRLAPTEVHFQEVIEKLALRYVDLKKYDIAVRLLRTLSERTADPQKIMNVYQEVLLMIPIRDRISVPADEIQYILEKFNAWLSFYEMSSATTSLSYNFFEKQIRDFGTTSHDYAKREKKNGAYRQAYLMRAREFYRLYLGYFWNSPNAVKIATNLADVHFALGKYLESGDYYLRVFSGEFGPAKEKRLLIENAILCFQKKANYSFFENLRLRGLLIEAIDQYVKFEPRRKNDAKLNFAKLKAEYEQGFFPEVLESCFDYMRKYRGSQQAVDAGELILDYFNTRGEFAGLENWANRMLGLKLPQQSFNAKLVGIRKQAKQKVLSEKVQSLASYDAFSQGKSYLAAALSMDDKGMSTEALRQALARSKAERDVMTFMDAASVMAVKEKDPRRKVQILRSMARENLRVTRFRAALSIYDEILKNTSFTAEDRRQAMEEGINTALLMRDWRVVQLGLSGQLGGEVGVATRNRAREHLSDVVSSPVSVPAGLPELVMRLGLTDDTMLSLFKAQYKVSSATQSRIRQEAQSRCGSQSKLLFCRWVNLQRMEGQLEQFKNRLKNAPRNLNGIEGVAQIFATVTSQLQSLEGSGDPLLESTLSVMSQDAYVNFANYLQDAADDNPDFKSVLSQKVQDSMASAKLYLERCQSIGGRSGSYRPKKGICREGKAPSVKDVLDMHTVSSPNPVTTDPTENEINDYRKALFAGKADESQLLQLATKYYKNGYFHHAAATASYGMSEFKQNQAEFRTILGCSVLDLGLVGEAAYHLRSGATLQGLREQCLGRLNHVMGDL